MDRTRTFLELETTAGLRHAFDVAYARIARAAGAHWQKHFASRPDPADAIVSVQLAPDVKRQRGSAFLIATRNAPPAPVRKTIRPQFAD